MADFTDTDALLGIPHWRTFDIVGDGSGVKNFNVDYSGTEYVTPGIRSWRNFKLNRIRITIVDIPNGWGLGRFSSSKPSLSRWLGLHITDPSVTIVRKSLTAQAIPRSENYFISDSGYDRNFQVFATKSVLTFEFAVYDMKNGRPVPLYVGPDHYDTSILTAFLNDDFSALARFQIAALIQFDSAMAAGAI